MIQDSVEKVHAYLRGWQRAVTDMLEQFEKKARFTETEWQHQEGGGGYTRVLSEGAVFEKAGVNFSRIRGTVLPKVATERRPQLAGLPYEVMGVSLVIHPRNPYVPTTHANLRMFKTEQPPEGQDEPIFWFGGGFDLTPYYGFEEDCQLWHEEAKRACDPFGESVYDDYKAWCDRYFYLPHRQEARGIGGLFFDDLSAWGFEKTFAFMQSVGAAFLRAYSLIVARRCAMSYGERERAFQRARRGRYVEFNLLYDRGTLFGLQTGGRTESILMSLPPSVAWPGEWDLTPNTVEARFVEEFLTPRDWVKAEVV